MFAITKIAIKKNKGFYYYQEQKHRKLKVMFATKKVS